MDNTYDHPHTETQLDLSFAVEVVDYYATLHGIELYAHAIGWLSVTPRYFDIAITQAYKCVQELMCRCLESGLQDENDIAYWQLLSQATLDFGELTFYTTDSLQIPAEEISHVVEQVKSCREILTHLHALYGVLYASREHTIYSDAVGGDEFIAHCVSEVYALYSHDATAMQIPKLTLLGHAQNMFLHGHRES